MKKIMMFFATFLGLMSLINCTTQVKNTDYFRREWMLVEFHNFKKDLMVKNNANLNLTNYSETEKKFTAKMGCNSMFGTADFKGNNKIEFSKIGSTMMYCDKNMDLESAFAKALPKMNQYKIEGHFLTLSDPEGNRMKFIASDWD